MKRLLLVISLSLIMPSAIGNEIPGTRVIGQGAVCAEGQGKALEFNIATREESSYCYEREPIVAPTQQQLETKAREEIARTITNQKNANPVTVVADTSITAEITPVIETLKAIEVNVATGVVTERELTESEKQIFAIDRAQGVAKTNAKEQAKLAAKANPGIEQCVNWSVNNTTGQECSLEPITATEEEIQEQYDFLQELLSFNWLNFLQLFSWNWHEIFMA